jgi:hypothetical protein
MSFERSPNRPIASPTSFGRNLMDAIPFSKQMLRPQNRYEIEKRKLEVGENQRHENYLSKGKKLPY